MGSDGEKERKQTLPSRPGEKKEQRKEGKLWMCRNLMASRPGGSELEQKNCNRGQGLDSKIWKTK